MCEGHRPKCSWCLRRGALLRQTVEHGKVAAPMYGHVCCAAPKSPIVEWPGLLLFSSSQETYSFPLRLWILSISTCEEAIWVVWGAPFTCPMTLSGSASLSCSRSLTKGLSQGWRFSSAVKSPDCCSLEQFFSVSVTSWPRHFGRWQASHFAICPSIWVCPYFLMIKLWLLIWRQSPTEVMVSSRFSIFDGIR